MTLEETTTTSPTTTADAASTDAASPIVPVKTGPSLQRKELLSETVLRALRGRQADFARACGARLSAYLRSDFEIAPGPVQVVGFQKFIAATTTPTHLTLLRIEPLRGMSLLDLPPRLGLNIVERQLGGPGNVENPDRQLTDLETALLDQVSEMILADWCASWADLQELKTGLLGHEIDVRFLNAIPRETMMIEFLYHTKMGNGRQSFRLGVPYDSLELTLRKLAPNPTGPVTHPAASVAASPVTWNPVFNDVPVRLVVECAGIELPARAVAALKVGDVLKINAAVFHNTRVRVGAKARFAGVAGQDDGRRAIQLTRKLED